MENLNIKSFYDGIYGIDIANGNSLLITHVGSSSFYANNHSFLFDHILCAPNLSHNLIFVSSFTRRNFVSIEFFPNYFLVKDIHTKQVLYKDQNNGGLYTMLLHSRMKKSFSLTTFLVSLPTWHTHLDHANFRLVQ